jgi:hypothetical protein
VKQNCANLWAASRAASGLESSTLSTWREGRPEGAGPSGTRAKSGGEGCVGAGAWHGRRTHAVATSSSLPRLQPSHAPGAPLPWPGGPADVVSKSAREGTNTTACSPARGGSRCGCWAKAPRRAAPCRRRRPEGGCRQGEGRGWRRGQRETGTCRRERGRQRWRNRQGRRPASVRGRQGFGAR